MYFTYMYIWKYTRDYYGSNSGNSNSGGGYSGDRDRDRDASSRSYTNDGNNSNKSSDSGRLPNDWLCSNVSFIIITIYTIFLLSYL